MKLDRAGTLLGFWLFSGLGCRPELARPASAERPSPEPSHHAANGDDPPAGSRCSSGVVRWDELEPCFCKDPRSATLEPREGTDWSGCYGRVAHDESLKDVVSVVSRAVPARVAAGDEARLEYVITSHAKEARSVVLRSRAEQRRERTSAGLAELPIGECRNDGSRREDQALILLEPERPLIVTSPFRAERPHGRLVQRTLPHEYDDCELTQVPLEPGRYEIEPAFSLFDLPSLPPATIEVVAAPSESRPIRSKSEVDLRRAFGAELPSVCRSGSRTLEELKACACEAHQFVIERDGRRMVRGGTYCGPGLYGRDLDELVRVSLDVSPKVVAPGASATLRYRIESSASTPLPVVLEVDYSTYARPVRVDGRAVPTGPCGHGGSSDVRQLLIVLEPGLPLVLELTADARIEYSSLPKQRATRRPQCQFWTGPLAPGRYRFPPQFGVFDLPRLADAELEVAE